MIGRLAGEKAALIDAVRNYFAALEAAQRDALGEDYAEIMAEMERQIGDTAVSNAKAHLLMVLERVA